MFKCPNTDCAVNQRGKEMPVFMTCPLCDTALESQRQFTPFQLKVKDNFPYVIAYPFIRMVEEPAGRNQLELLAFTLINVLKYLGLITASEYYDSSIKSQKLNELFRNNLYQPSVGNWNQFIREAIKELNNKNHKWIFPELIAVYENIESGNAVKKYKTETEVTNENGETIWLETTDTAIGTLINFRNKHLGHGAPQTNDEYKELFDKYYPVLEDLLSGIALLAEISMFKSDQRHVYKLMGLKVQNIEGHESFLEENVWIEKDERKINLLPFFVLPQQFAGIKDNPQVFVYEQNTSARVVFFSPESKKAESQGVVFGKMNDLIAEKENEPSLSAAELTRAKIDKRIDANNLKLRNGLIREKKIIKGVYQNRKKEEEVLMNWIGLPYGLLFINAEAGSGKTNLLDYANTLYQQQNHSSLFLRANHLDTGSPETVIKKLLNIDNAVSMQELLKYYSQQDPLIIVIDGGNEHANADNFLKQLVEWLLQNKGGALKIVLSWRSATEGSLPILEEVEDILYKAPKYQQQHIHVTSVTVDAQTGAVKEAGLGLAVNQTEGHPLVKNALKLDAFNREELLQVWGKYTEYKEAKNKKMFAPQFTAEDLEKTDKPLLEQLNNPLLLRMFLEYFNEKKYKSIGDGFTEIWEFWWRALSKNKKHVEFLSALAIYLAEKDMLTIELDELYMHPLLGKEFENLQSNSPYRQLLEKGELVSFFKNNKLMAGFVMEKKFYFVLSHILIIQQPDKAAILKLLETGTKWKEAITYYLTHLVKNKQYDLLFELIDEIAIDKSILSKPLAQAIITQDIQKVLDGLLQKPTKRDWQILGNSIWYLVEADKIEKIREIGGLIFEKAIAFEPYELIIGDSLYNYLNLKQRNVHIEKLKQIDLGEKNIDNVENYICAARHLDSKTSIGYYDVCEEILLNEKNGKLDLALIYLNKAARYIDLLYKSFGEERTELEKKAIDNLNKSENIYKNNTAKYCYNLIIIYINFCWIYSQEVWVEGKNVTKDGIKAKFYLAEAYKLFERYFGSERGLLESIINVEANFLKTENPENAVVLWKEAIKFNNEIYGHAADNKDYYFRIAESSTSKKESLSYYSLYLKEIRKEIYATKSIELVGKYFRTATDFYWQRSLFFRGLPFWGVLALPLFISCRMSKRYFIFLLIPFLILFMISLIVLVPLYYFNITKKSTNWDKH